MLTAPLTVIALTLEAKPTASLFDPAPKLIKLVTLDTIEFLPCTIEFVPCSNVSDIDAIAM